MFEEGKTNKKILKLLYRSFDAELKEKEKRLLEQALEKSEGLRKEKELIMERRQAIAESASQSFRAQFADRVMARIAGIDQEESSMESFYEGLKIAFKRLAIIGAVAVLALIFFNLIKGDIIPVEEVFFASDMAFEEILNLPLF